MDLTEFIIVGNNRKEAFADFVEFESGFDEDCKNMLSYEKFCEELDKGYGNSEYIQIARLYEDKNGTIWYDKDYVA